jgi:hypothetical protein
MPANTAFAVRIASGVLFAAPMTRLLLLSAFALSAHFALPARSEAQTQRGVKLQEGRTLDDLKPGAKLRLLMEGTDPSERLHGRLRGFGATSLTLDTDGSPREIPVLSILLLEESYRDRKRGALAGALTAIVAVYAWDFFGPHPRYTDQDKRYKENAVALAISVPGAALMGGAIGWHRWRSIPVR